MNQIYTPRTLIPALVFLFGLHSAGYSQTNHSDQVRESIEETYSQLTQLLKDGKPEKVAQQFYTEDAKFFPPNGGVVAGTEAIGKAFGGLLQAGLYVVPEVQEVETCGSAAYEYGIGTLYNTDGEAVRKERYIVIWKKENGRWKMYRDFVKGLAMK